MQDFRELEVWRRAHQLALGLYRVTEGWPKSENFGLTHQVRRSVTTVASRIAEGCGGNDLAMELRRARALSSELEYFLLLAHDLGHLDDASYERFSGDTVEIQKMLSGLLRKL